MVGQRNMRHPIHAPRAQDRGINNSHIIGRAQHDDARTIMDSIELFEQAIHHLHAIIPVIPDESGTTSKTVHFVHEQNTRRCGARVSKTLSH